MQTNIIITDFWEGKIHSFRYTTPHLIFLLDFSVKKKRGFQREIFNIKLLHCNNTYDFVFIYYLEKLFVLMCVCVNIWVLGLIYYLMSITHYA